MNSQINAGGGASGSFTPVLLAFKSTAEQLSQIHNHMTLRLGELTRELTKYSDELHRKHKQVKDEEAPTVAAVRTVQDGALGLAKAKETYRLRCQEVDRLKRQDGAASQKELEKAEAKLRRSQEDYRTMVAAYSSAKDEFEKRMTAAAKRFQQLETSHLAQLRQHVETYCQIMDHSNNQVGRVSRTTRIFFSRPFT